MSSDKPESINSHAGCFDHIGLRRLHTKTDQSLPGSAVLVDKLLNSSLLSSRRVLSIQDMHLNHNMHHMCTVVAYALVHALCEACCVCIPYVHPNTLDRVSAVNAAGYT